MNIPKGNARYDVLYKNGNFLILRFKKGRFKKIPMPRFFDGQIVKTSKKHFSQKTFTMVTGPSWTETRGWVYSERFINRDRISGGVSCWHNEDLFEEITNFKDKLIAEKFYLEDSIEQIKNKLRNKESELLKISYALSLD